MWLEVNILASYCYISTALNVLLCFHMFCVHRNQISGLGGRFVEKGHAPICLIKDFRKKIEQYIK